MSTGDTICAAHGMTPCKCREALERTLTYLERRVAGTQGYGELVLLPLVRKTLGATDLEPESILSGDDDRVLEVQFNRRPNDEEVIAFREYVSRFRAWT